MDQQDIEYAQKAYENLHNLLESNDALPEWAERQEHEYEVSKEEAFEFIRDRQAVLHARWGEERHEWTDEEKTRFEEELQWLDEMDNQVMGIEAHEIY